VVSEIDYYVVATVGEWNEKKFHECSSELDGEWDLAVKPDELVSLIAQRRPKKIFFPHWRWIVPESITGSTECVCFHMTDVPYGRGGSPLQNLIERGHVSTKLTALRMTSDVDAGPVYLKRPLSLEGAAKEIYQRSTDLIWEMIADLVREDIAPVPQRGTPTFFQRRTPAQSEMPADMSLDKTYDFIRMLDAPGYPHAFIKKGGLVIEFTDAQLQEGAVTATATIYKG
jgi:methionyl-tRNA formyltransferase